MQIVNHDIVAYPSMIEGAVLLAVLTRDEAGLYAAYVGLVPFKGLDSATRAVEQSEQANWIARHGHKLTHEKSKQFFRGIDAEEYRR
ncbi:MAG TPA: hypothetical protein VKB76_11350 [Ktedonobacterales bacterium]|nr:hypothetical protein [Ktedonobacterales bacterium]